MALGMAGRASARELHTAFKKQHVGQASADRRKTVRGDHIA